MCCAYEPRPKSALYLQEHGNASISTRPRISLAMWRLRVALVACLWHYCASQQQCPSFASLSPPSGLVTSPYLLVGENLDAVANVTVTKDVEGTLDLTYAVVDSKSIQINFAVGSIFATFSATVTLHPVNSSICINVDVPGIMLYIQGEYASATMRGGSFNRRMG